MSNLFNNLSLENKVQLTATAVKELINATYQNKKIDEINYQYVQDLTKSFKELKDTVTRLTNTYLVVQDDLKSINTRLHELEAAYLVELGDRK